MVEWLFNSSYTSRRFQMLTGIGLVRIDVKFGGSIAFVSPLLTVYQYAVKAPWIE